MPRPIGDWERDRRYDELLVTVNRQGDRLGAIRRLHREVERRKTGKWWPVRLLLPFGDRTVCEHCTYNLLGGDDDNDHQPFALVLYPCPTIRALDGEPTTIRSRDV